jgi:ABC-type Zn uptake system ZnuABC Zn-binding protein ZnuA
MTMCRLHFEISGGRRALQGIAALALLGSAAHAEPLRVVASTPELGSLVREVGGDQVTVTVLAKPSEDPHFVEAKPSFVKEMNQAELYVANGLDLEIGYQSVLLTGARNARILPGNPGYIDGSVAITPMDVPLVPVDRSMGDVHPFGNPHYLLDPLMGLKVAALLRDTLAALRPENGGYFAQRYDAFKQRVDEALVGLTLAQQYGAEKLATLFHTSAPRRSTITRSGPTSRAASVSRSSATWNRSPACRRPPSTCRS